VRNCQHPNSLVVPAMKYLLVVYMTTSPKH
jgi:hypothetical protein